MSASCLRAGTLRLCLALMLGLLVVSGYLVAPLLFKYAGSQQLAGMLAGHIFHSANLGILFLAVAAAMFWLRMDGQGPSQNKLRWGLLLALVLLVAVNEFALAPKMAALKAAMGPIDLLPKDNPQRAEFGMWHGISAVLHLLSTLAAAWLVALGPKDNGASCKSS
ncbi:MAG TPA: DUF4149 domain-containing protein [Mariprofundaceae bacterium]|nr:DUF4149 domain-containing protein [Mariprofundaceae bacterium]